MLNNFYHHINRVLLLLPILIPCITHGKELFPNCLHNEIFVFNTTATQQLENHASELHHDHLVMPIYCTDTRYSNCKAIPIPEQKAQDLFLKLRHLRLRHLRLTLMCVYTEELMCNLSACHSSFCYFPRLRTFAYSLLCCCKQTADILYTYSKKMFQILETLSGVENHIVPSQHHMP